MATTETTGTAATIVRPRPRAVNAEKKPMVTTAMKALARSFHTHTQERNSADTKAKKARKELLADMADAGISEFSMTTKVGDKAVTLDVSIDTPQLVSVDVKKLRSLVDEELFMKIVSATKTSVVDHAGSVVFGQCSTTVAGTTNVNVKVRKNG